MTDVTLFKQFAAEKLPESLYQQMEPHLETLMSEFIDSERARGEMEYEISKSNRYRYNEIHEEFKKLLTPMWVAYARLSWPEIDEYYNLEPIQEVDSNNTFQQFCSEIFEDDAPF